MPSVATGRVAFSVCYAGPTTLVKACDQGTAATFTKEEGEAKVYR